MKLLTIERIQVWWPGDDDPVKWKQFSAELEVPEIFEVLFVVKGLNPRINTLIEIFLTIFINDRGIPMTQNISINHNWSALPSEAKRIERIDPELVAIIGSQLREFEALAFSTLDKDFHSIRPWIPGESAKKLKERMSVYDIEDRERIKRLKREVMKRTSYRSLSDQFLSEIRDLYFEAKEKGKAINDYIAKEIAHRDGLDVGSKINENTVQRWIKEAKDRKILITPRKKSVKTTQQIDPT